VKEVSHSALHALVFVKEVSHSPLHALVSLVQEIS
jgi:hypothetical protein